MTIVVSSTPTSDVVKALRAALYFMPFKAAHCGTIMSDITNEVLTVEEIRELRETRERFRNQDLRDEQPELPEDIQLELEASSKIQLKNKLKQYARETIKFEGGKWTKTGTINKVYLPELKKYQVDAAQMISAIGKGPSELYNETRYIFEEGGDEKTMSTILEKTRRLAVYCLATGKELDRDAKDLSTKALRLPDNLKYLEDDNEDDNKDLFFSPEVIEKIQKTRFEESVIKRSVMI
jgi:hypothetical protein